MSSVRTRHVAQSVAMVPPGRDGADDERAPHVAVPGAAAAARFRLGRRPALDGLRGIAILAVMDFHLSVGHARGRFLTDGGYYGVDLFFVLSGFLITTLLLEEWQRAGALDMRRFYQRRALRLLPALVVACAGALGIALLRGSAGETRHALVGSVASLLYVSNGVYAWGDLGHGPLGVTWSLAIEEQFYLLWPLALLVLLRRGASRRALLGVALGGAALAALGRAALWVAGVGWATLYALLPTRADGLLAGCALGIVATSGWLPESARARRWLGRGVWAGVALLGGIMVTASVPWVDAKPYLGFFSLAALATTLLLAGVLVAPPRLATAVLECAPLVWLGQLSYGFYLWHGVLFFYVIQQGDLSVQTRAAALALTFVAAPLSYYLVERRFLARKARLRAVAAPAVELVGGLAAETG